MPSLTALLSRHLGRGPKLPYPVEDSYQGLRALVLGLRPAQLGESDADKILAVLMETGYDVAAVSLVAVCDGAASLYIGNGGGILGAGGHLQGKAASLALVAESAKYRDRFAAIKDAPLPRPGQVHFHLVTGHGLWTASAKEIDLGEKRHDLFPLFFKAQELITVMRLIEEARTSQGGRGSNPVRLLRTRGSNRNESRDAGC